MNPPPEIRFTLNRLDLLDWTWRYVLRSRALLAMSLLSSGFITWTSYRAGRPPFFLVTLAILTFIIEWVGFLVVIPLLTLLRTHPTFLVEAAVRADEEGLHAVSSRGQSTVAWGTFERVRHGRQRIFLCLTSSGGVVIPHRAFATDADRRTFEAYCAGQIAQAREASRPTHGTAA